MSRLLGLWAAVLIAGSGWSVVHGGIEIDSPMETDPPLELPATEKYLSPNYKPLWFAALQGPESELRMRAAEAIARARSSELDSMSDAVPHLIDALKRPDERLPVRLSLARALVLLDSRDAADALFEQVQRGELEMQQIAEPALAEWGFAPIRSVWLESLAEPNTPVPLLLLAVRGLGTAHETSAREELLAIAATAKRPARVRLEAARALGVIQAQGLEKVARELASDTTQRGLVGRLVAASMLGLHESSDAITLLQELALDQEPTVAAIALRHLLEIDAKLVLPLADRVVDSPDANVRRLGAEALVAVPSASAVATLEPLLDDPHPDVRAYVRDSLFELAASDELNEPVRQAGMRMLATDRWRGLEQASLLLGALDHEPAADRLLVLLEFPRPEVMVASAWALRRLALVETLDPIFELALRRTEQAKAKGFQAGFDGQLAQIFQFFGQTNYARSDALLREYVPKNFLLGLDARAAAIWTLGHFHAGEPDQGLASALQARIRDVIGGPGNPPEFPEVRRMAAVTLGRMEARGALPTLREFGSPEGASDESSAACNWAVTQVTGETFPPPKTVRTTESGWFLEPLE